VFRFTIRDVLWLITASALCLAVYLGFHAERVVLIRRARQAEDDAMRATEMLLGTPTQQKHRQPDHQMPVDVAPTDPNKKDA